MESDHSFQQADRDEGLRHAYTHALPYDPKRQSRPYYRKMSNESSTADHLNEMIGKVRAEKAMVDMQRRHTEIHSRNEKAQRLVKRLQDCDSVSVSD